MKARFVVRSDRCVGAAARLDVAQTAHARRRPCNPERTAGHDHTVRAAGVPRPAGWLHQGARGVSDSRSSWFYALSHRDSFPRPVGTCATRCRPAIPGPEFGPSGRASWTRSCDSAPAQARTLGIVHVDPCGRDSVRDRSDRTGWLQIRNCSCPPAAGGTDGIMFAPVRCVRIPAHSLACVLRDARCEPWVRSGPWDRQGRLRSPRRWPAEPSQAVASRLVGPKAWARCEPDRGPPS